VSGKIDVLTWGLTLVALGGAGYVLVKGASGLGRSLDNMFENSDAGMNPESRQAIATSFEVAETNVTEGQTELDLYLKELRAGGWHTKDPKYFRLVVSERQELNEFLAMMQTYENDFTRVNYDKTIKEQNEYYLAHNRTVAYYNRVFG